MARKNQKPTGTVGVNQSDTLPNKTVEATKDVRGNPTDITVDASLVKTDAVDQSLLPNSTVPKTDSNIQLGQVSTVLRPSGHSVSTGGVSTLRSVTFSGNDALVVGGASQTTKTDGGQQKNTRFERKDETIVNSINDVTNAQTYIENVGPKDLNENPEAVQGSDGRRVPTPVLIQKRSGFVPQERNFNASLDIIDQDLIAYVDKQVIYPGPTSDTDCYPDENYTFDKDGAVISVPYENVRGNFVPRQMEVTFSSTGNITDINVISDDITVYGVGDDIANASSPAALTHRNKIELARQVIYDNSGDPKSDKFSPLGRKVYQPNGLISMYRDYEAMTGSEVAMSIRSLSHALSFQINKAAKDGQTPVGSAFDMSYGSISSLFSGSSSVRSLGSGDDPLFDGELLQIGAANTLIKAYDSVRKYNTRGDLLTIRKSYRSFIEAAKHHCSTFRYPVDLLSYINNKQTFSTISHDYDEQLPVYMTGFTSLAHPRNFETCYKMENSTESGAYLIQYNDDIDSSFTYMNLPLLKGISRYLQKNSGKIFRALDFKGNTRKWIIPIQHSFEYITIWDQLVCASTTDIEYARQESFREFLDYESNFGPIFSDLVNIDFDTITSAKNFKYTDYTQPLTVGRMSPSTAASWLIPELWHPLYEDKDDERRMMLPLLYSEATLSTGEVDVDNLSINFPLMRRGINLASLSDLINGDERQFRLSYDIPTDIPATFKDTTNRTVDFYKYSKLTHGVPVYGYKKNNKAAFPTVGEIHCLPRELGLGFVPVQMYLRRTLNILTYESGWSAEMNTPIDGTHSYTATIWAANVDAPDDILKVSSRNNARGANFEQTWYKILAKRNSSVADESGRINLSRNALFTTTGVAANKGKFKPLATASGPKSTSKMVYMLNLNKADYFIQDMMDFLYNPFDIAGLPSLANVETLITDPLDRLYNYGFLGFIASNYTEDHRNRVNVMDVAGMSYVEDYYRDSCPLLM